MQKKNKLTQINSKFFENPNIKGFLYILQIPRNPTNPTILRRVCKFNLRRQCSRMEFSYKQVEVLYLFRIHDFHLPSSCCPRTCQEVEERTIKHVNTTSSKSTHPSSLSRRNNRHYNELSKYTPLSIVTSNLNLNL